MRIIYWIIAGAFGFALIGGYLGDLHPAGDSLAVFRLECALALVVLGVLGGLARLGLGTMGLGLLGVAVGGWIGIGHVPSGGPVGGPVGGPAEGQMRVYQKNLWVWNADTGPLAEDIRAANADFAAFQEVGRRNAQILVQVSDHLPHQRRCENDRIATIAIVSRWPFAPSPALCDTQAGFIAAQVRTPAGPIWLVSVHLSWPWPFGQAAQIARLSAALAGLEGPMVIAGDFNSVAWSASLRRLRRATDTDRLGHLLHTFDLTPVTGLGIDHVFLRGLHGGGLARRDKLGSDHFGLIATFDGPNVEPQS